MSTPTENQVKNARAVVAYADARAEAIRAAAAIMDLAVWLTTEVERQHYRIGADELSEKAARAADTLLRAADARDALQKLAADATRRAYAAEAKAEKATPAVKRVKVKKPR